ncbi:MAG: hypothetical protein MJZ13_09100 [Bacteroidales bacterium]|nr:hypothetical protein [Bacteroidales bacterium]
MSKQIISALLCAPLCINAVAQDIPAVYEVENTGAHFSSPAMPNIDGLRYCQELTDPLEWSDGSGRIASFDEWAKRRNEIANEIMHYEIGTKPAVNRENIKARMDGDTLYVDITIGSNTLTLRTEIEYPVTGEAPYALMIGTSHISLPGDVMADRPIAKLTFHERQVNGYSQFRGDLDRKNYGFVKLYPDLINNGAYSEWTWGVSRLIDALQILGPEVTRIDTKRIGVTGCSYAGKMALFSGAFDERIALTIAQEPGGGGAAAWRVSHTMTEVEDLDRTDYHWFKESLKEQFHGDSVYYLPYDHHELCAMIFPRALLVLGNPDYKWLADGSAYVSVNAARKVWETFGVEDRIGYSILANHPHCQLPREQYNEVMMFIDKFLLGKKDIDTQNVRIAPMFDGVTDLDKWIKE